MLLLLDIGNTHTHLGLADARGVRKQTNIKTALWRSGEAGGPVLRFIGKTRLEGVALCSVVPAVTGKAVTFARKEFGLAALELTPHTIAGVGINYPQPERIGPDRLANAVALRHHFGAPSVAVAFGTALAFDVVDRHGDYAGGIIAPGLAAMTDYLHDKTALLPRITIRETSSVIGKSTREAMLIGAVHGYRGLVRELIMELKRELRCRRLPVVATGGYAELIAAKLPEITAVEPGLTLEGLRLVWLARNIAM
ncbi:MAG: Type III pantothenate kinase [Limisphaerales bacterium]|nr:MAG: Type III pantothenate kinase [Limisphaerales bacterium]TXT48858.1 MAG: Type III pantothenate kinase [Limisphaerales bacterium]